MSKTLIARVPVIEEQDVVVALIIGTPDLSPGDSITIRDMTAMQDYPELNVREIFVDQIINIPVEVLTVLGFATFSELRKELSNATGVGIPAEAQITIIVAADPDADLDALYEDDDIEPLDDDFLDLFSLEDDEDLN